MILKNNLLPKFLSLAKNLQKINHQFCSNKNPQSTKTLSQTQSQSDNKISSIPSLKQFINQSNPDKITQGSPIDDLQNHETFVKSYQALHSQNEQQQTVTEKFTPLKYHIETYGCQMNVNDSQIVRSILSKSTQLFNPDETQTPQEANVVFLNTCAIRDSAQQKIYTRIRQLRANKNIKILGLLGCMAERLRDKMFAQGVNIICGPDTYRDLPKLIEISLQQNGIKNQMNVQLSVEQTYADITPVRKNISKISAFLSIMRGCNNMCSFCIVPFVRGRERSRNVDTILKQIEILQNDGVKQVTFLGQNVNSYHDISTVDGTTTTGNHQNSQGFSETFKLRNNPGVRFAELLEISAKAFPNLRFRFTSPHPKDFPDEMLEKIATYHNICKYIHLPAQSGNTEMLFKMRRNHTRQAYLNLVQKMKNMIPTLTLSTDLICGFCGQTQEQFQDTLNLLQTVKYENAFLFMYSMREKTHAHRNYVDDVPLQVKKDRLKRMIDTFTEVQRPLNQKQINQNHLLLIENTSKKDQNKWIGKTDNFKKAVVQKGKIPYFKNGEFAGEKDIELGDYVAVKVESAGPRSLGCKPIAIVDKLSDYNRFESKILSFNSQRVQSVV